MKRIVCLLLVASTSLLRAQALVEYGLAAAASGTAGTGAQRAASGIGGVLSGLNKTLHATPEAATASAPTTAAAPAPEAAKPTVAYEDAAGIRKDMDRAELLRRFGEPAMRITVGPGRESLTYESKSARVEVDLRDNKVAWVEVQIKPKQQTAVVSLQ